MAKHTQENRPLKVFTDLGTDALLITGFRGREAISQLFSFELDLLADKAIDFSQLLGQKATVALRLGDDSERHFNGIVRRLSQGDADNELTSYRAELVPQFWGWTKKVRCRVFQQLTVAEILRQVLVGLDVSFQLTQGYPRREYCVQYGESDFAFANRLMEDEGIHFYFRHSLDRHELVISDSDLVHPNVPGANDLTYDRGKGGIRIWPRVTSWRKSQEIRGGKYTTWDYNFEIPAQHLEASAKPRASVSIGDVSHQLLTGVNSDWETFEYPGGYARHADAVGSNGADRPEALGTLSSASQRTARLRAEADAVEGLQIEAVSEAGQLLPGCVFSLTRHSDANGKYLVTEVTHTATLPLSQGDPVFEYGNRFTCLPVDLPYRPARVTPKPRISGPQTATVVGPAGQESYLDKHGRVKIQFHWDRESKKDGKSSRWVRVAQIWAGKNWGAFFWPRVGHEVVVAFEEGDPDCPLIVGSVYNGVNVPPVSLPDDAIFAGIKSCISGKDPTTHFNSLIFDDKVGDEFVVLHSHKTAMKNNIGDDYEYTPGRKVTFAGDLPF